MNLVLATVLLCSDLQSAMFTLYRVENGNITTADYGTAEVCDYAVKFGSEDLQRMCVDFEDARCEE